MLIARKEITYQPLTETAVNLIGPWTIKVGKRQMTFSALTISDPVTNLTELVRIENKTADHGLGNLPRHSSQDIYDQKYKSMTMEENSLILNSKNYWNNAKLKTYLPQVGIQPLTSFASKYIRQLETY